MRAIRAGRLGKIRLIGYFVLAADFPARRGKGTPVRQHLRFSHYALSKPHSNSWCCWTQSTKVVNPAGLAPLSSGSPYQKISSA